MKKRAAVELLLLVCLLLLASGFGAQDVTDLQITQTASPARRSRRLPAGNITWTIDVTNNGQFADTNVQVSDLIPATTSTSG